MFEFLKNKNEAEFYAPVNGECVSIETVPDETFSSKLMGEGIAFKFDGDKVSAPISGDIILIAETLHAFAIRDKNGIEVLIHIGLDTVNLKGKGFKKLVQENSKVKKGDPIIEVDREVMRENNINMITMMIITETNNFNLEFLQEDKKVSLEDVVIKGYK